MRSFPDLSQAGALQLAWRCVFAVGKAFSWVFKLSPVLGWLLFEADSVASPFHEVFALLPLGVLLFRTSGGQRPVGIPIGG